EDAVAALDHRRMAARTVTGIDRRGVVRGRMTEVTIDEDGDRACARLPLSGARLLGLEPHQRIAGCGSDGHLGGGAGLPTQGVGHTDGHEVRPYRLVAMAATDGKVAVRPADTDRVKDGTVAPVDAGAQTVSAGLGVSGGEGRQLRIEH